MTKVIINKFEDVFKTESGNKYTKYMLNITYFIVKSIPRKIYIVIATFELAIQFCINKRFRSSSKPYFKSMAKFFQYSPITLYSYKGECEFTTDTIEAKFSRSGYIKEVTYPVKYHKLDKEGRPLVTNKQHWGGKQLKVAITGGSTVAGSGCNSNNESLPSMLQKRLGYRYEVDNFGVGGYSTWDEFIYYWSRDRKHDLLIHYTGWNTIAFSGLLTGVGLNETNKTYFATNEILQEHNQFIRRYKSLGFLGIDNWGLEKLYAKTLTMRFAKRVKVNNRFNKNQDSMPARNIREVRPQIFLTPKESAKAAVRALQCSYALSKVNAKQFLVAIQPLIINKSKLSAIEEFIMNDHKRPWQTAQENSIGIINEYFAELLKLLKELNIPYVDLRDSFKGVKYQVFSDECHLIKEGNEIIGQRLGEYVEKLYQNE